MRKTYKLYKPHLIHWHICDYCLQDRASYRTESDQDICQACVDEGRGKEVAPPPALVICGYRPKEAAA